MDSDKQAENANKPGTNTTRATHQEYHSEEEKDIRKKTRLDLIKFVIIICAAGIAIILGMIFADLIHFQKDIHTSPSILGITTALFTTLTTALGAVIGSSID